jgi:hypothetical protein
MADGLRYQAPDETEGGSGDNPAEESDEYMQAAQEAFPDDDWTPERIDALKALIKLCMDNGGDMGAPKKGHTLIEMMFGGDKHSKD